MHTEMPDTAAVVDRVIRSRKTVRAFRPDPVPRAQLVEILEVARMAPSNFNTQPWRVHVLVGEAKRALSEAISQAHSARECQIFCVRGARRLVHGGGRRF